MIKIGNAIDIHKFGSDKPLMLGGVKIDYTTGLVGHSDADVLLHAVCEAIIGALGLGDIGMHFPDTDSQYANADSSQFVLQAVQMMQDANYRINNVDISIICEAPNLKDYKKLMKDNIAVLLNTVAHNINIKATRGEQLGFIGRGEGIVVICSLLLIEEEKNGA